MHTYQKFLNVVSSLQAITQKSILEKCQNCENELEKIHCRNTTFGVLVEPKSDDFSDIYSETEEIALEKFPPQSIAKAILFKANFNCDYLSFISPEDAIDNLMSFLIDILDNPGKIAQKKKTRVIQ